MSECYEECPVCEGTTFDCPIAETPCNWCDGEGVVLHDCPESSAGEWPYSQDTVA